MSDINFDEIGLSEPILDTLKKVGYEKPSPIQAQIIPHILNGYDVLGQAQTGTGKTAAFALPILSRLDMSIKRPQVLVLTPTRELAIQVAESFKTYALNIKNFHVLPIYGGQDYGIQLRSLKRDVNVVVGTPGRVIDHIKRGTLDLDSINTFVLDEADEMLRMGFIDDVEWIMGNMPNSRQVALFSATMPKPIKKIANNYLKNPKEVSIKVKTTTADTIRQRYWLVSGIHKLDALTRILEAEFFDGVIIFVRTKTQTIELAQKLEARGYLSSALNGDLTQKQREKTVENFKKGRLDILIATDVAARGLDVERVSHVINYDIPYDTESYVHRIGRTGRAGRSGDAILFVSPKERRLLSAIEKATKKKIELMELPTVKTINNKRIEKFKQKITDALSTNELEFYINLIEEYAVEHNVSHIEIAAALSKLNQGGKDFLLKESKTQHKKETQNTAGRNLEKFRLEVGYSHGAKPNHIVGAIANESGLSSKNIGKIEIFENYSIVSLPKGMPDDIFYTLKKCKICNQKLNISKLNATQNRRKRKKEDSFN